MKIAYGVNVEDKNGNFIGQVNHVIRDSWTGNIKKFGVWSESFDKDWLVSPENIQDMKEDKITLSIAVEEQTK